MNRTCTIIAVLAALSMSFNSTRAQSNRPRIPNLAAFSDPTGDVRTYSPGGDLDLTGPFFQPLGTNGRTCGTCHQPADGMTISAAHVATRFDLTLGADPIFSANDGSNCDHDIDTATLSGRTAAFSLLRTRGLIRIAMAVPDNRDFEIVNVMNPYRCNETNIISVYRRPLPTANLKFLSAVMWDGRESSTQTSTTPISSANYPQTLMSNLAHQSMDAVLTHAMGAAPPTAAQQQAIVEFEMGLYTAQADDKGSGSLQAQGATAGPQALSGQQFYIGMNDPVGLDPMNPVPFNFSTTIFNIFDAWENTRSPHRQAVNRGQTVFNTKTFTITNVPGLTGNTFSNGVTAPDSITATCGICHDTPNAGNHSVSAPLNIAVADPPGSPNNILDVTYLPVITVCQRPGLTNCVQTTDPGRALVTGLFADVGKFKGPVLRGLAARAPYFHNGAAASLQQAVDFYDTRFSIGFTEQEKSDLIAFLNSL
jgi:cytochrome c peroxidase